MARFNWRLWSVIGLALGLSGCMLCDRYCERQQDRCRSHQAPSCCPAPVNNCGPASGSYYPQPVQTYAPPPCP